MDPRGEKILNYSKHNKNHPRHGDHVSNTMGLLLFLHPGRLTWNIIMEVWKIIFLSKWVICRFQPLIFQGVSTKYPSQIHLITNWSRLCFSCFLIQQHHQEKQQRKGKVGRNLFMNGLNVSVQIPAMHPQVLYSAVNMPEFYNKHLFFVKKTPLAILASNMENPQVVPFVIQTHFFVNQAQESWMPCTTVIPECHVTP